MRQARRDLELAALFGRGLVEQAHATDVAELELSAARMEAVHDAADDLLTHCGDTVAQHEIIRSLDPDTRLVLCMWCLDMSMAARLAARAIREPMPVCG
jgi:hypothetical protein